MTSDNVRERRSEKRHLTLVLISGTESKKTRTISASLWQILGISAAALLTIVALLTAAIIYTPLGSRLPISNPKLEQEYGGLIVEIRDRMERLVVQVSELRTYNLKLRRAMGETLSAEDSAMVGVGGLDDLNLNGAEWDDANPDSASQALSERAHDDSGIAADGASQADSEPGVFVTSTIPGRGTATLTVPVAREGPIAAAVPFNVPAEGFLTREFEPDELHYGIDFAAKEGSPVWAAAPGSVIFSGWTPADGNVMMIAHSLGYVTVYKHNKALHKTTGQPVRRGEVIAAVGSTGKSTGPHLHFEVWRNGMPLDAGEYILAHQ